MQNRDDSLQGLEALIESLRGNTDAALKMLSEKTDDDSIKKRLSLLIDAERFSDAVALIEDRSYASTWVDRAAFVFAATGDSAKSITCFKWAHDNAELHNAHRTGVGLVDGTFHNIVRSRNPRSQLVPGTLAPSEVLTLTMIADALRPLCDITLVRGLIDTEAESLFLQRNLDLSYVLSNRSRVSEILGVLIRRAPIPSRVGTAIIQGLLTPTVTLTDRLWVEHPSDFDARLTSCVVVHRQLRDSRLAVERSKQLVPAAITQDDKDGLTEFLYELHCADTSLLPFVEFSNLAANLVATDSRLMRLFEADQLTRQERYDDALTILEAIRDNDDPRWLRGYANVKLSQGHSSEALTLLKQLGRAAPDPEVFRAIVKVSGDQGLVDDERDALEHTLSFDPDNVEASYRLAMLFVKTKDYDRAAKQFERLHLLVPTEESFFINLAVSYCFAGNLESAVRVLEHPHDSYRDSIHVLLAKASLLESIGRATDAHLELSSARSQYWSKPEFLVAFMSVSYAAGKEADASEALTQLIELQSRGEVDQTLMRPVDITDITDMVRRDRDRREEIGRYLIKGHLPWLTAAETQREAPMWSWLLRTQPLQWQVSDHIERASYCLYVTNSFSVVRAQDNSSLEQVECASAGAPVVADLTALITLYQCELLEKAADYFETIFVPSLYLTKVHVDARRLLPHQASTKEAAEAILAAVDSKHISVIGEANDHSIKAIWIDEYAEIVDGQSPRPLRDILGLMYREGLITDAEFEKLTRLGLKQESPDDLLPQLQLRSQISIGAITLDVVARHGLLRQMVKAFDLHISRDSLREFTSRRNAFLLMETARHSLSDMWNRLKADTRYRFLALRGGSASFGQDNEDVDIAFAGMRLSQEHKVPLIVDDRSIQAVVLNEKASDPAAAFGADCLVTTLVATQRILVAEGAARMLQLMEWRYRFLVMPPEMLKVLASDNQSHPPGQRLRRVAKYLHECMSDAGLLAGLESTSTPTSIAVRFYLSWVQSVAEFIIDIWLDRQCTEDFADKLTEWAMQELMPSVPCTMNPQQQAKLAELTHRASMSRALIKSSVSGDHERMNRALLAISRSLSVSEKEYLEIITNVVSPADE